MPRIDPLVLQIRDARKAAGLTQRQLAEKAGLCLSTVAYWETGHRKPMLTALRAVLDALGLDAGVFPKEEPR